MQGSSDRDLGHAGFSTPPPRRFFTRSARDVAPELLGCWLLRRTPQGIMGGRIVETEAYITDDPACHAARGLTERNRVMFGPAGHAYVYFIYGCHFCVNAVCMPPGIGEAVLIRAIEPSLGAGLMQQQRSVAIQHLTNGPGKLCAAMSIGRELNGIDLCNPASPLFVARDRAHRQDLGPVITSPRIGITKAASLPLRFYLRDSRYLSRKHAES